MIHNKYFLQKMIAIKLRYLSRTVARFSFPKSNSLHLRFDHTQNS